MSDLPSADESLPQGQAQLFVDSPTYRLPPGQTLAFPNALPQGVLATDQNLFGLLLTRLGSEVVFVVGQGL